MSFLLKILVNFPNACVHFSVAQLCPTLCDLMDCSPTGSSVHEIIQARIPEWVAIFSPSGSSILCIKYIFFLRYIFRLLFLNRSVRKGNGTPLQYSCLEKSHGWKSLAGYSPRGYKRIGHGLTTTKDNSNFIFLALWHWLKYPIQDVWREVNSGPFYLVCNLKEKDFSFPFSLFFCGNDLSDWESLPLSCFTNSF